MRYLASARAVGGKLFQQQMAVIVEVADDGHTQPALVEALDDMRNRRGGFVVVDRDAHDLRAGQSERRSLLDGALNVPRVGVGHRLHDDRKLPADANLPNLDDACFSALNLRHASSLPANPPELVYIPIPLTLISSHSSTREGSKCLSARPKCASRPKR